MLTDGVPDGGRSHAERMFLAWWYGYQSSRLLAFGLFGRAAWRTT